MKLITKKEKIANVAENYRLEHPYYEWRGNTKDKDIYNRLLDAKTENDIINIVGRNFTNNICSECGEDNEVLVELVESDYDSYYAICKICLNKVRDLFSTAGVNV